MRRVGGRGRDIERVGRINFESLSRNRMLVNVTLLPVEDDGDTETGSVRGSGKDKLEITDETHCAAGNLGSYNNYRRTRNYILCPRGSLSSSSSSSLSSSLSSSCHRRRRRRELSLRLSMQLQRNMQLHAL